MKRFFILFFILSMGFANYGVSQEVLVGKIADDQIEMTYDKTKLLDAYHTNLLKVFGVDEQFTDVNIIALENNSFCLVFTGELYKATFEIKQKGTELYALGRTSYTTSDCTSEPAGCIPTEGLPTKCKKECVTRVLTHRPEGFLVPINWDHNKPVL